MREKIETATEAQSKENRPDSKAKRSILDEEDLHRVQRLMITAMLRIEIFKYYVRKEAFWRMRKR